MAESLPDLNTQIYTIFGNVQRTRDEVLRRHTEAEDMLYEAEQARRKGVGLAVLEAIAEGKEETLIGPEHMPLETRCRNASRRIELLSWAIDQLPAFARKANDEVDALLTGRLITASVLPDATRQVMGLVHNGGVVSFSPEWSQDAKTGLYVSSDTMNGHLHLAHATDPQQAWRVQLYGIVDPVPQASFTAASPEA